MFKTTYSEKLAIRYTRFLSKVLGEYRTYKRIRVEYWPGNVDHYFILGVKQA